MRLPSAYQEVEYIQSSGTQYIDTGVTINSEGRVFQLKYEMVSAGILFGTIQNFGESYTHTRFARLSNNFEWDCYSGNGYGRITYNKSLVTGNYEEIELGNNYIKDLSSGTILVSGTAVNKTTSSTIPLFCAWNETTSTYASFSSMKLAYFTIIDNGDKVRELVPCYRKSDNEIGMYDLVNDTFYTNSGTGIFLKGNDVIPEYKLHGAIQTFHQKKKWKPNENTVAYYPLTSDTQATDQSGNNRNLTNYNVSFGTYNGVNCGNFNGSAYLYSGTSLFSGSQTFTVNWWFRRTGSYASNWNIMAVGTRNNPNCWIAWIKPETGTLYNGGWSNDRDTQYSVPQDQWINLVFVHNSGQMDIYVNGVNYYSGAVSYGITTNYTAIGCGVNGENPVIGNFSEVIVENKKWTAQEASDYYNLTKANYGIS